jgi:probable HAF family extracellular repeat protein
MNLLFKRTGAVCAVLCPMLFSTFASAQYVATKLGTLGGPGSSAIGLNDLGQVVGSAQINAQGWGHAFVWTNGKMQDLGTVDGNIDSYAVAINNFGVIVGNSGDSGFIYSNGSLSPVYGPNKVELTGVNNDGVVVGTALVNVVGQQNSEYRASTWFNGYRTDLGIIPSASYSAKGSVGMGINDNNQVVGQSYDDTSRSFLYENGTMRKIYDASWGTSASSFAVGINTKGSIIGFFHNYLNNGNYFPYLLRNGVTEVLQGRVIDINDNDEVLGEIGEAGYIYANGKYTFLSTLPEVIAAGWTYFRPAAINNVGQIAGSTWVKENGAYTAALLSPIQQVPEASAEVLALFGVGVVIVYSRRKKSAYN